ncbi:hypothetical protein [Haloarchaeobius sp. HRN-SO-5]|uniref:hypothetical protein n=1 Tax=Haloarchaeobius sp. HRN-SO-5 TaxID=3446118 RepID=UPI003EB897E6
MATTFDTGGGGGDLDSYDTADGDKYSLHDAIGSGSLTTSLDSDTLDAEETIDGMAGTTTYGETQEDDTEVATTDASDSVESLEDTQQTIEDATGGAAYGDPSETETIGHGEAVTDTTPETVEQDSDGLPMAVVGILVLVAVVAGGGA